MAEKMAKNGPVTRQQGCNPGGRRSKFSYQYADGDYGLLGRVDDVSNIPGHCLGTRKSRAPWCRTRRTSAVRTASRDKAFTPTSPAGRFRIHGRREKGTVRPAAQRDRSDRLAGYHPVGGSPRPVCVRRRAGRRFALPHPHENERARRTRRAAELLARNSIGKPCRHSDRVPSHGGEAGVRFGRSDRQLIPTPNFCEIIRRSSS